MCAAACVSRLVLPNKTVSLALAMINSTIWTFGLIKAEKAMHNECGDDEVDIRGAAGEFLISRSPKRVACSMVDVGPAHQQAGAKGVDGPSGRTRYVIHGPEIGEGKGVVVLLHGVSMTCDMWSEYW